MIIEAVDLLDRVAAVEFAMEIALSDITADRRRDVALTYAAGNFYAIDGRDAGVERREIRVGRPRTPIFTFKSDDEIIGSVICSVATIAHPLRVMMIATRSDWRGKGVGFEMLEHVTATARTVGVVPARDGLRGFFEFAGFKHWHRGAEGGWVGFTRPIAPPSGLLFAVPASANYEVEEARGSLVNDRGMVADTMDISA